jgi:hypothetical protein
MAGIHTDGAFKIGNARVASRAVIGGTAQFFAHV